MEQGFRSDLFLAKDTEHFRELPAHPATTSESKQFVLFDLRG